MSVRDKGGRANDIRSLFHNTATGHTSSMKFVAEMIVPTLGQDDLGQAAKASITFLRYTLELGYRPSGIDSVRPSLIINQEELDYISLSEATRNLPFKPSNRWVRSVIKGRRTSPFISTDASKTGNTVRLHQEGRSGRTRDFLATTLPRTVLSTVNAAESPTALLARREMQSWRLLQLEPSALRASDSFTAPTQMGADGSHLPATLYQLARTAAQRPDTPSDVYTIVSNRLADLIEDVKRVNVERDDARELLTLTVRGKDETVHPARALSDGTLRFLALTVLEADPNARGVLCFEEPENGIHPERITAMLDLLQDLAVNTDEAVGEDNPLRQVIINTHSPTVVAQVPDDSLLFAHRVEQVVDSERTSTVVLRPLPDTWRVRAMPEIQPIPRGLIVRFLNPVRPNLDDTQHDAFSRFQKVYERDDIAQLLLWPQLAKGRR